MTTAINTPSTRLKHGRKKYIRIKTENEFLQLKWQNSRHSSSERAKHEGRGLLLPVLRSFRVPTYFAKLFISSGAACCDSPMNVVVVRFLDGGSLPSDLVPRHTKTRRTRAVLFDFFI